MTEIERLAAAIKTISEKYLTAVVKKKDEKGILKWSTRLADYSTRLSAIVAPPLTVAERTALAPAVVAAPNFGDRPEMSSGLYGEWVGDWVVKTFPEAYRDWPPLVYAITPQALLAAAQRDNCVAQVAACGNFGEPDGVFAGTVDFSLYTALTGTNTDDGQFLHRVWHMGKLVGETVGGPGDGLDFAEVLGFNW